MILFVIPTPFKGTYASGNWKDNTGICFLFEGLDHPHKIVHIEEGCYDELLDNCSRDVTDVVLYYSFWSDVLTEVRRKAPWIRLHVRTVNAEAFQHWQRAEVTLAPTRRNLRAVYGMQRLLLADASCRRRADTLLGISEWDNSFYWGWLPGRAKVSYMPYFSPWPHIRPNVKPLQWQDRSRAIVCMAGGRDAIGRTMIAGFSQLAEKCANETAGEGWQFLLSRGVVGSGKPDGTSSNVTLLDRLNEPWDLLCSVRAVAVLTPLGFGMKTTVVDALAAGCHVIVDPILARRLPSDVRSRCLVFDQRGRSSALDLFERLSDPPLSIDFNETLRLESAKQLADAIAR